MKQIRYLTEQFKLPVAFVSTYTPRECGMATFTRDISDAVIKLNPQAGSYVVAVNDENNTYLYNDRVKYIIDQEDRQSYLRAANLINASPARLVNIQHEFGIFGGSEGEYVLTLLAHLRKPIVVTFHTTPSQPSPRLKELTQIISGYADKVVGLTEKSVELLRDVYEINSDKLTAIYHGVPNVRKLPTFRFKKVLGLAERKVLLTFGLINKAKGIEYVLQALPRIIEKHPDVIYLILGETHPVVRRFEGEVYREKLEEMVAQLGLQDHVVFKNEYLSFNDLVRYLLATDVYLTPYLSKDQIASGTLAYAIGAGKAIVSTPYLYAEEAVADGRGLLVDFGDSDGLAETVSRILSDKALKAQLERATYRYGRQMIWPNVAKEYATLFNEIIRSQREQEKRVVLAPKISPAQELAAKGSLPLV